MPLDPNCRLLRSPAKRIFRTHLLSSPVTSLLVLFPICFIVGHLSRALCLVRHLSSPSVGLSDINQASDSNLSDISQRPDHGPWDSRNRLKQEPITPLRGRLPCGQAAGAKRPCQLWMPLRQHLSLSKNVPQTTHKAILHASFVQRQTLGMSDIEPAAKPQLGPLAACNRVAPLAPVKRNVRQAVRHFDPLDGRPAREAHHRP